MEELQNKLQTELDKLKDVGKQYNNAVSQRQVLDGQLHENMGVKQELELLKSDGEVYKMIGPVLVKQELNEAKQNVCKRIDYITAELKRMDDLISTLDAEQDQQREKLAKLQQQFQLQQTKAAKS
ncbi:prefoldin beta subunit [Nesidiocoris tenuis]|uniref:Prefoldin beta subunit n=1 Tax=Nesidiocoris tenuis TaxID=355587 RepID=A0ABN7B695_9HEMI|nr:prefoldin beta subunit [Nesidiocoris tenuis]